MSEAKEIREQLESIADSDLVLFATFIYNSNLETVKEHIERIAGNSEAGLPF